MISVIVPIYNVSCYLDQCIGSILSQTFEDWECILIDDGSTDGSSVICENWVNKDSRISVIHQQNAGVSAARNSGIEKAKGEWITFVDADDWLEPDYLSSMISHSIDSDLLVSGQIREYEDGRTIIYKPERTEKILFSSDDAEAFNKLNVSFLLYAPHEKLFRADIIKSNKLAFQVGCSYGEDLQFVYAYLEYVNTISTIDMALYHYRMGNSGTLSTKFRKNQFDEDYRQWLIVYGFYERHGLLCELSNQYLAKRLWGIVYDGIFLYPKLKFIPKNYLDKILNIYEHDFLCYFSYVFPCSTWVKLAFKNKSSFIFKLLLKLRYFNHF